MSTSAEIRTQVSQLYVAMFGRAPDAEGLKYWAGLLGGGYTMPQVADIMFGTAPARSYFPAGLDNEALISSFYLNVLGRLADADGLAFWSAKLDAAGATPGSVIAEMIDVVAKYSGSDPAGLASAALFNNRAAAAQFYAENGGSLVNASAVLAGVSAESQTVMEAREFHQDFALGVLDVGGYSSISLGLLLGNVVLTHVVDGSVLRVADGESGFNVNVQLADAGGADNALRVVLPEAEFYSFNLQLAGVEHLAIDAASGGVSLIESLHLRFAQLESIVITGSANLALYDLSVGLIDATAFTGTFSTKMDESTVVLGSAGADSLWGYGAGGRLEAGAGNDLLGAFGPITLFGGGGSDTFQFSDRLDQPLPAIGDFEPGIDVLSLYSLVTNKSPAGMGTPNHGTWYAQPISLGAGATFDAYLNAAANVQPHPTYAAISWFQHGGNTYLVIDNSLQSTFQQGTDCYIELMGLRNLSGLSYMSASAQLG